MDKLELIQKIKQLEGITRDERAYLVDLVNTSKKYGLVWEDKPEDVEEQLRDKLPVLREVVEKRTLGKDFQNAPNDEVEKSKPNLFTGEVSENDGNMLSQEADKDYPNHILIEGDNLHALTALTFTHEGRIDVIYIDPPYNTGESDFKYNDKFIDKENGFRHSLWLSFMNKRLKIIKRLLSETGVFITHIDENEFDALSILLESEIFTEFECLGCIIWNKKNPKGDAKGVATMHEYVLCLQNPKLVFFLFKIH
jgi:adenine-specific DNA-methyltransferase